MSTNENATENASTAGKPLFDLTTALTESGEAITLTEDNKLTAVPGNWNAAFRPLKVTDFAEKALHLEWRALQFDLRARQLAQRGTELREQAKIERTGGDPVAKNMSKARKLRKQLQGALQALAAEGIDIDQFSAEELGIDLNA